MLNDLNLNDFDVVNDSLIRDDETPRQYLQRMTGHDIPEIDTLTWDHVRRMNIDALNRDITSPFANLLMRSTQPRLILRKKS